MRTYADMYIAGYDGQLVRCPYAASTQLDQRMKVITLGSRYGYRPAKRGIGYSGK